MRFDSIHKPPAAPSWRIIIWMITLVPMMLMASWFSRRSQLSPQSNGVSGLSKDDVHRLDRILHSADESTKTTSVGTSDRNLSSSHDRASLTSVSDKAFGIPKSERATYEAWLNRASVADQADLERTAHRDVPFAVLMLEPDRFRGDLITIEGDLRRLNRIPATSADTAESDSYEAWIFTADSGLNPYRVVCTSLPTGFAFGDQLTPPIRVRATGYFFKRYSYATAGNYHTAPLLLAKTLARLTSHKPSVQLPNHRARTLAITTVCILLVVSIGWMIVGSTGRRAKRKSGNTSSDELTSFNWPNDDPPSQPNLTSATPQISVVPLEHQPRQA